MSVVGFDIGNESCVIGVARRKAIDILQNEIGKRNTASLVAFQGKQRFLGDEGSSQVLSNAENSVRHMKRLLGLRMDDPDIKTEKFFMPYKLVPDEKGNVLVEVTYEDKKQRFKPEQIVGAQLGKLKRITEQGLEGRISDCVIGCPAWWPDNKRRALLDAAQIAGLNVLRLMNETTALALNYGLLRPLPKDKTLQVLFIDVGHASTEVALVSFVEGKLVVLGTAYDKHLGGRSFDMMLMEHFAKYIQKKYRLDVMNNVKARGKLEKECERVKKVLSANQHVPFNVEYIMEGQDVAGAIDRNEFDAMCADQILKRLIVPVQEVLAKTGVRKEDLFAIEGVGGGIRIPCVKNALRDFFGREISQTCDGDEAIARGLTLQCAMLSPSWKVKEFEVQDANAYPIELQWGPVGGNEIESSTALFPANNPVPSVKMISFKDRTEPFQLTARYGDSKELPPGTNPLIGRFVVSGMPRKEEGKKAPKIKVRVKLNVHTLVTVSSAQLIEELSEEEQKAAAAAATPAPATPAPAADGIAPMTDEQKSEAEKKAEEEKKKAEEEKKKKKVKRTELQVTSSLAGLDQKEIASFVEREAAMCNQDRVIFETNDARNALESFVLEMRSRVEDESDLGKWIRDSDRNPYVQQLTQTEEWLYDAGGDAQKSEYKSRLTELRALPDGAAYRKREAENRDEFVSALKGVIVRYGALSSTRDEKYSHITPEERKKVAEESSKMDQWLIAELIKQDRVPPHENPVLTCENLKKRREDLENFAGGIMNRAKPKPPEEKKEEKKADSGAGAAGATGGQTPPPQGAASGAGAGGAGGAGSAGSGAGAEPMDTSTH